MLTETPVRVLLAVMVKVPAEKVPLSNPVVGFNVIVLGNPVAENEFAPKLFRISSLTPDPAARASSVLKICP